MRHDLSYTEPFQKKRKKNRLDVHANERKVPETYMNYYYNILDNVPTRNFRHRVTEPVSKYKQESTSICRKVGET